MGRTEGLVAVGVAFLLCHVGVAVWQGPTSNRELYPVFRWSLFSEIPDPTLTDYGIRFTRIDGTPLEEPRYFEQSRAFLPTAYQRPEAYQVIQRLGGAVARGNELQIAELEALLEDRWMSEVGQADYELVRRRFDIIERVRCDCFQQVELLRTGTT